MREGQKFVLTIICVVLGLHIEGYLAASTQSSNGLELTTNSSNNLTSIKTPVVLSSTTSTINSSFIPSPLGSTSAFSTNGIFQPSNLNRTAENGTSSVTSTATPAVTNQYNPSNETNTNSYYNSPRNFNQTSWNPPQAAKQPVGTTIGNSSSSVVWAYGIRSPATSNATAVVGQRGEPPVNQTFQRRTTNETVPLGDGLVRTKSDRDTGINSKNQQSVSNVESSTNQSRNIPGTTNGTLQINSSIDLQGTTNQSSGIPTLTLNTNFPNTTDQQTNNPDANLTKFGDLKSTTLGPRSIYNDSLSEEANKELDDEEALGSKYALQKRKRRASGGAGVDVDDEDEAENKREDNHSSHPTDRYLKFDGNVSTERSGPSSTDQLAPTTEGTLAEKGKGSQKPLPISSLASVNLNSTPLSSFNSTTNSPTSFTSTTMFPSSFNSSSNFTNSTTVAFETSFNSTTTNDGLSNWTSMESSNPRVTHVSNFSTPSFGTFSSTPNTSTASSTTPSQDLGTTSILTNPQVVNNISRVMHKVREFRVQNSTKTSAGTAGNVSTTTVGVKKVSTSTKGGSTTSTPRYFGESGKENKTAKGEDKSFFGDVVDSVSSFFSNIF